MRLWTIQPIEVWEELKEKGYFACNPEKAKNLLEGNFKYAYDWLVEEMKKRTASRPEGVIYPIWAWHTYNWKHKKLDLRESGYKKRGTKCVCIEVEVPDNKVVLTDFDAWHYVLNKWYNDESTCEEEWEKNQKWFESLTKEEQDKVKVESWQKTFDISTCDTKWNVRGRYIQATFWELRLKDVKKVQFFVAR